MKNIVILIFLTFGYIHSGYAWSDYYDDSVEPSQESLDHQDTRLEDEFRRDPDHTVIKGCYHSLYCAGLDSGAKTVGICKAHGGRSYKTISLTCKNL